MRPRRLVFRLHALQRMFERHISVDDVRQVLDTSETIEVYPQDMPHAARLVVGWPRKRPIHVVAADDPESHITIVITAYQPSTDLWEPDFRRRKRR